MKIMIFADCMPIGYDKDPENTRYPALLEGYFTHSNSKARVIISCHSGETSFKAVEKVNDIIEENPDVVILGWGINDGLPRGLGRSQRAWIIRWMYKLKMGYRTRLFFRAFFLNPLEWLCLLLGNPKYYVHLEDTRSNFHTILERIQSCSNAKIIVLTPGPVKNYRFIGSEKSLLKYNEVITSVCDSHQVRVIDVYGLFCENGLDKALAEDKFHYSIYGHKLVAEEIIKAIEEKDE